MTNKEKLIVQRREYMTKVQGLLYMGRPKVGKYKEVMSLMNKIKKLTDKINSSV